MDPADWIKGLELGRNSKISRPQESKQLDWIEPTGLVNSNQAETSVFETPVDWIGSSRLDWLIQIRQKLQSSRIQSTELDPSNWIHVNSVLMKAHLCFKVLQVQGPLDPICLDSEVQIREED